MRRRPAGLFDTASVMARALAGAAVLALGAAAPVAAQAAPEGSVFLPVGTMAPDFEVQGATRYGLIAQPIRLSQFHGKTVVLAFYFRVRGGG